MERSQRAMVGQINQHRLDVKCKEGDLVLSSKNITSTRRCKKLDDKKHGPFKIKALVGSSYRMDLPKTNRPCGYMTSSTLNAESGHRRPVAGPEESPPGANDG